MDEALKGFCEEIQQHLDIITGYRDSAAELKGQKICPACGRHVDRSVSFCPFCGSVCPTPQPETETAEGDVIDSETEEIVAEAENEAEKAEETAAEAENEAEEAEATVEAENETEETTE